MTVLGGNPTIGIAGLFSTFTFTWMVESRLRPRLCKIEHLSNWKDRKTLRKMIGSSPTSDALHVSGYGVNRGLVPIGGVGDGSLCHSSTVGRVSRLEASLYPFFDLRKVIIEPVKTNSPFIVPFFVEYA